MECDFWQAIRMFDNPLENFLVDTISYTAQKKVKCVQRKDLFQLINSIEVFL